MLIAAEAEVFGSWQADGSFSEDQSKLKINNWCQTNKSLAESNQQLYEETRTLFFRRT